MKYKILKGTATYHKLEALCKRMMAADRAAYKLVQEIRKEMGLPHKGSKHTYASQSDVLAGGIMAIGFDAKPEGWKVVGEPWQKLFAPKANRKDLWERIKVLPKLQLHELNDIVGFKKGMSASKDLSWVIHRAPGMEWVDEAFLMEVPSNCKYTPPNADIVEILESEYQRLSQEKKKTAKT